MGVSEALNLKLIPPSDFIYQKLGQCETCFRLGHNSSECNGTTCVRCKQLGYTCQSHDRIFNDIMSTPFCSKCLSEGHWKNKCTIGLRCRVCSLLGHLGRDSKTAHNGKKRNWTWRVKADTLWDKLTTTKPELVCKYRGKQINQLRKYTKQIWKIKHDYRESGHKIRQQREISSLSGRVQHPAQQIWRIKHDPRIRFDT